MSKATTPGEKKLYEKFWFISVVSLILAWSLIQLHHRWEHSVDPDLHLMGLIAKEAGFACLVAFFLNLSIEWINRRRHADHEESLVKIIDQKHQERIELLLSNLRSEHDKLLRDLSVDLEAKHKTHTTELLLNLDRKYNETNTKLLKDVFQTVYERYIEPGVFKIIDTHVLKKDVMRKGYKASLTIRQLEGENPDSLVVLCFADSYEVVNLTDKIINVPLIGTMIDITPAYEDKCKFVSAIIDGTHFDAAALSKNIVQDDEQALWKLVLMGEIPPRGSVKVSLQYSKVGPKTYSEVICTTVQMDSLEMEIFSHDPQLSVYAVSLHPDDADHLPHPLNPEHTSWKINHAILPGQGIVVFWHPRREPRLIAEVDEHQIIAAPTV